MKLKKYTYSDIAILNKKIDILNRDLISGKLPKGSMSSKMKFVHIEKKAKDLSSKMPAQVKRMGGFKSILNKLVGKIWGYNKKGQVKRKVLSKLKYRSII